MKNIIPLKKCYWNKEQRFISVVSEFFSGSFPKTVTIESERTGVQMTFVPVQPGDYFFDEDSWDGEQMIYKPTTQNPKVNRLIVYHEF